MFKVDDGFYDSIKVKSIPRGAARKGALALWTLAGSWSDKHSQDGFIPATQIEELHCSAKDAQWLVASTLWHDIDNPCPRDRKTRSDVRGRPMRHQCGDCVPLKQAQDELDGVRADLASSEAEWAADQPERANRLKVLESLVHDKGGSETK